MGVSFEQYLDPYKIRRSRHIGWGLLRIFGGFAVSCHLGGSEELLLIGGRRC